MDQKAIINHVKKHRVKRGLTRKQLADKIGTRDDVLYQIERGTRSFSVNRWVDLCAAFKIKAKDLVELDYKMVQEMVDKVRKGEK